MAKRQRSAKIRKENKRLTGHVGKAVSNAGFDPLPQRTDNKDKGGKRKLSKEREAPKKKQHTKGESASKSSEGRRSQNYQKHGGKWGQRVFGECLRTVITGEAKLHTSVGVRKGSGGRF